MAQTWLGRVARSLVPEVDEIPHPRALLGLLQDPKPLVTAHSLDAIVVDAVALPAQMGLLPLWASPHSHSWKSGPPVRGRRTGPERNSPSDQRRRFIRKSWIVVTTMANAAMQMTTGVS